MCLSFHDLSLILKEGKRHLNEMQGWKWGLCALHCMKSSSSQSIFGLNTIFSLICSILLTVVTVRALDWTRNLVSHGSWWLRSCRCVLVELGLPSGSRRSCGQRRGPILDPHCVCLKQDLCCCCYCCCYCYHDNGPRLMKTEPMYKKQSFNWIRS